MSESYYHILGIPSDADEREIKRAYHRLARELHPDKAASPQDAREAEQRFAIISKAYNVLKDPALRKDYDSKKTGGSSGNGAEAQRRRTPTQSVMQSAPRQASSQAGGSSATETKKSDGSATASEIRTVKTDAAGLSAQRATIAQKAFAKGVQLVKRKDYHRAIEFFEAAINNNPNEAPYHAYLSMALVNAKRSASKALEAAERAIELDTYNLDYKLNLAQIYQMIGSKSHAIKTYEDIIRWDEKNQVATQMLRELKKKDNFFSRLADQSPVIASIQRLFQKK